MSETNNKITNSSIVDKNSNDAFFMLQAESQSELSKCLKIKVGSVLVKDDIIIGRGFNKAPCECAECNVLKKGHCDKAIHAEAETLIDALHRNAIPEGATMYVTHFPCVECSQLIKNAGISRLVYKRDYNDERGDQKAYLWGIELRQVE